MPGKVLIVDDEEALRYFAANRLAHAGWQVSEAESGRAALALLKINPCDVLLLDLRMGEMDGLSVMRKVKQRWPDLPVIIMTAYASVDSAIEAVRQGAFDYLRKPCAAAELLNRTEQALAYKEELDRQKLLLKQAEDNVTTVEVEQRYLALGSLVVGLDSYTVSLDNEPVALTPTEYQLLRLLAESPGEAVSTDRLIKEGLGYNESDPQAHETLRVHISRLRGKLDRRYIRTIRRGGYVLADVPEAAPTR